MTPEQAAAIRAAQLANLGSLDLLSIARFGDGEVGAADAHEAENRLLRAARLTMELAGFRPEEKERGELYRAITSYTSTLAED